jgi:Xaa-Pro dipeptidase
MSEPVDFCKKRMRHIRDLMEENDLNLVLLARGTRSSMYMRLLDTSSGTTLLIPRDGNPLLFCYPVNYESTKDEAWVPVRKLESRASANEVIAEAANEHLKDGSRVGLNAGALNYETYISLSEKLKGELTDISSTIIPDVFYGLYPGEVKYQRTVSRLADIAVAAAREAMTPGVKEHEVAAEANYAMMRRGAEQQSFPTIVSSGERSAYCHGWPGDRELKEGDLVIVDLGPMKHGYAADETRTFLVGGDGKKERMLEAMDRSVAAVLDRIKPGASCKDLDAISRDVLKEHGFPDYPHSLGHPISGFVVPSLSKTSEHVLREGMIFTVEPGIYLPSYGGVRMEENIVITEDGFEQLTKSPRMS